MSVLISPVKSHTSFYFKMWEDLHCRLLKERGGKANILSNFIGLAVLLAKQMSSSRSVIFLLEVPIWN